MSIDQRLRHILSTIWKEEVKVKSRIARYNADIIAMAASKNLITTRVGPEVYGGGWQITAKGLRYLNETEE